MLDKKINRYIVASTIAALICTGMPDKGYATKTFEYQNDKTSRRVIRGLPVLDQDGTQVFDDHAIAYELMGEISLLKKIHKAKKKQKIGKWMQKASKVVKPLASATKLAASADPEPTSKMVVKAVATILPRIINLHGKMVQNAGRKHELKETRKVSSQFTLLDELDIEIENLNQLNDKLYKKWHKKMSEKLKFNRNLLRNLKNKVKDTLYLTVKEERKNAIRDRYIAEIEETKQTIKEYADQKKALLSRLKRLPSSTKQSEWEDAHGSLMKLYRQIKLLKELKHVDSIAKYCEELIRIKHLQSANLVKLLTDSLQ